MNDSDNVYATTITVTINVENVGYDHIDKIDNIGDYIAKVVAAATDRNGHPGVEVKDCAVATESVLIEGPGLAA